MELLDRFVAEKVERQTNIMVQEIANVVNECFFRAMRQHGIGNDRANKILEMTETFIEIENKKVQISK